MVEAELSIRFICFGVCFCGEVGGFDSKGNGGFDIIVFVFFILSILK